MEIKQEAPAFGSRLTALLVIGRVSNLPTVWSNCLAAKALTLGPVLAFGALPLFGADDALLLAGATLVYLCGTWLNDVADVDFDRAHRPGRPIPAGLLSRPLVGLLGGSAGAAGAGLMLWAGASGPLVAALLAAVLLYTALHKKWSGGVILMGLCRTLLGAAAASVFFRYRNAAGPLPWHALAWGAAVGVHIVGLSAMARREATGGKVPVWSRVLLFAPAALVFLGAFFKLFDLTSQDSVFAAVPSIGFSVAALFWTFRSVSHLRADHPARIARSVSSLLAGLALYDAAISASVDLPTALLALAFFAVARVSQQFLPAT